MVPWIAVTPRRGGALEQDIHLRLQREHSGIGHIAETDRRPASLRKIELNLFPGERVSGFLVKQQIRGGEMDRILQLFGSRLVRMNQAFRVGFKIHLDLALAHHVAGLRVVLKIRAIDLVEAAGIATIQGNGDVMQLGAPALPVLHCLAGLNLEYGVPLLGAGNGETFGALLDFNPDFCRHFLKRVLHPVAGVEIHRHHHQQQSDGAPRKPAAKLGNLDRHP